LLIRVRIRLGNGTAVMGVINVSPESFFAGSIRRNREIVDAARAMIEAGAVAIDIGGMSTAPFKATWVPEDVEAERLINAVKLIRDELGNEVVISIDSFRPGVVSKVAEIGIDVINDVTGLRYSETLADVAADHGLQMILCARELEETGRDPLQAVIEEGHRVIEVAARHGVDDVILDPCLGFPPIISDPSLNPGRPARGRYSDWFRRDIYMISNIARIKALGKPICVGASRKGFIRKALGKEMGRELGGSLGVAAYLMMSGIDLLRVHDVEETMDLIRIIKMMQECSGKSFRQCLRDRVEP
jgi:dihydropteroate synthase